MSPEKGFKIRVKIFSCRFGPMLKVRGLNTIIKFVKIILFQKVNAKNFIRVQTGHEHKKSSRPECAHIGRQISKSRGKPKE